MLKSPTSRRKPCKQKPQDRRTCPSFFEGAQHAGFQERARLGWGRDAVDRVLKIIATSRMFWKNRSEVTCRQRGEGDSVCEGLPAPSWGPDRGATGAAAVRSSHRGGSARKDRPVALRRAHPDSHSPTGCTARGARTQPRRGTPLAWVNAIRLRAGLGQRQRKQWPAVLRLGFVKLAVSQSAASLAVNTSAAKEKDKHALAQPAWLRG